jgi:hypothetical protein
MCESKEESLSISEKDFYDFYNEFRNRTIKSDSEMGTVRNFYCIMLDVLRERNRK